VSTNVSTISSTYPKEMKIHEDPSGGIYVVSCGQTDQRKVVALRKFIIKKKMRITVREVKKEIIRDE
jgi:hypothetical protein